MLKQGPSDICKCRITKTADGVVEQKGRKRKKEKYDRIS